MKSALAILLLGLMLPAPRLDRSFISARFSGSAGVRTETNVVDTRRTFKEQLKPYDY
jgi:hypothetical protein